MWRSFRRLAGQLSLEGRAYPLIERTQVARATHRLRFSLDDPGASLGLPVGQHVSVYLPDSEQSRAYTPTSSDRQRGFFDLVVKEYPGGILSKYLGALKVGDSAVISGPHGELVYHGDGRFELTDEFDEDEVKQVVSPVVAMVAGGTGITPMFQIMRWAVESGDLLKAHVLFANREVDDVMLKPELDELVAKAEGRLNVNYSVDKVTAEWPHLSGFVSKEMLKSTLPPSTECDLVCICGPSGFHSAVAEILEELGYDEEDTFHF